MLAFPSNISKMWLKIDIKWPKIGQKLTKISNLSLKGKFKGPDFRLHVWSVSCPLKIAWCDIKVVFLFAFWNRKECMMRREPLSILILRENHVSYHHFSYFSNEVKIEVSIIEMKMFHWVKSWIARGKKNQIPSDEDQIFPGFFEVFF